VLVGERPPAVDGSPLLHPALSAALPSKIQNTGEPVAGLYVNIVLLT
jgi:hypothetical protein